MLLLFGNYRYSGDPWRDRAVVAAVVIFLLLAAFMVGRTFIGNDGGTDGARGGPSGGSQVPGAGQPGRSTRARETGDKPGSKRKKIAIGRKKRPGVIIKKAPDRIPPVVNYRILNSRRTAEGAVARSARLALYGGDRESGMKRIDWRSGRSGPWRTYSGPIALAAKAYRKKGEVQYRAVDRAGNISRAALFSYTIDDIAPELPPLGLGSRATGGSRGRLIPREGIVIPAFEKGARLVYRINGGRFKPCREGDVIKIDSDGVYSITFRISDELGNSRQKTYRAKSDTRPPETRIQINNR